VAPRFPEFDFAVKVAKLEGRGEVEREMKCGGRDGVGGGNEVRKDEGGRMRTQNKADAFFRHVITLRVLNIHKGYSQGCRAIKAAQKTQKHEQ
jgi:hypothetical protein